MWNAIQKVRVDVQEPLWRTILNYGCVAYFLGLPAIAIFLGFSHFEFGVNTQINTFLREFHFAVTALVAEVAGLNSFDRRSGVQAANGKEATNISIK